MRILLMRSILPMLCVITGALVASATETTLPPEEQIGVQAGILCGPSCDGDAGMCTQCCHEKLGVHDNPDAALTCWNICTSDWP